MRTVAILGSWDTKAAEMSFLAERISAAGIKPLLIDFSTLPTDSPCDYTAVDILQEHQSEWTALSREGRGKKIDFMAGAVSKFVQRLSEEGSFDGIISAGGLQNTTVAVAAMKHLPRGFPKVMATTVASGHREFASVTDNRDIVIVPALADFTGINLVSQSTLETAADCVIGLVNGRRSDTDAKTHPIIGVSMMGVTNNGATAVLRELENLGFEAVGFHATGAGGPVMEEFVETGLLDGVLDLTLHEITSEYFGGGFSSGAYGRLETSIKRGLPLLVCPGGLDFVDYYVRDFEPGLAGRKHILHNGSLAHIKLNQQEARAVGELVGSRLAKAKKQVPVLVPEKGFRADTEENGALHDVDIDETLIESMVKAADGRIDLERVPLSLDSSEFGTLAAQRFAEIYCREATGLMPQPAAEGA